MATREHRASLAKELILAIPRTTTMKSGNRTPDLLLGREHHRITFAI